MMNEQPQRSSAESGDESEDQVIRQLLARCPAEESPGEIEAQVLSRVTRRRYTLRAVRAGIGVTAVVALGILARPYVTLGPPTTPLATNGRTAGGPAIDTTPLIIANSRLVSLTASAPVVRFPLLNQDQLAILQCLKSLEEEEL